MELKDIKGLGKTSIEYLKEENINSADELMYNYPISYDIYELDSNKAFSGEMTCINVIVDSKVAFIKYRSNVYSIIFYVFIGSFRVKCILFSGDYLRYKLKQGVNCVLYGKYKLDDKEFAVRHIFFDDFCNKVSVNYNYKRLKSYQIQKAVNR